MRVLNAFLILLVACNANPNRKPASTGSASGQKSATTQQSPASPRTSGDSTTHHKLPAGLEELIISERIDGPAYIRDKPNGKVLFILNDHTPVTATEAQNNWLQIGLIIDLDTAASDQPLLKRQSKLFIDGKEAGITVANVHLESILKTNEGIKGELVGYTATSNIKPHSVPEKALATIIDAGEPYTLQKLQPFLRNFNFQPFTGLLPGLKGYEIDENWIDDPSPLLRLWLLFERGELVGLFHARPLQLKNTSTQKTERGFYYSSFSNDKNRDAQIVDAFNEYISQVD